MWGRARVPALGLRLRIFVILFYAWPNLGVLIHTRKHAALDRQISFVVRACRSICSARDGRHGCVTARLLCSQGYSPVPRVGFSGNCAVGHPRHRLLQSRLLPCRDNIAIGASAAVVAAALPAERRCSRLRIDGTNSSCETLLIAIDTRPSASLYRLTNHLNRLRS
jgi:hypothetical protein